MGKLWKRIASLSMAAVLCLSAVPPVSSAPGGGDRRLESVARTCATPEQLALFLNENLVFQEDRSMFGQTDYWQAPEEVLVRGRGDCEDYALLANDLLNRQGRESFVFSLYGDQGYAHTVCVFVEENRYNVLNQDRLVRCRAASLEELAGKIYPGWRWAAVARRQGHRGRAVRLIRRKG